MLFGARTRFKANVRHLGAHLMVSNKWVVIVGAHLGCGRNGVHLTPRENTLGYFGLKLGLRQIPSVWSLTVYPLHSLFYV